MLHLPTMLESLFGFGMLMMGGFVAWKLVVASKGIAVRGLGLVVLTTGATAYFWPNLLGQ